MTKEEKNHILELLVNDAVICYDVALDPWAYGYNPQYDVIDYLIQDPKDIKVRLLEQVKHYRLSTESYYVLDAMEEEIFREQHRRYIALQEKEDTTPKEVLKKEVEDFIEWQWLVGCSYKRPCEGILERIRYKEED